jgi:hypothetical protein
MSAGKIYTVHEKPEASDAADRMVLVREGFSWAALIFTVLWLLAQRLWMAAVVYVGLVAAVMFAAEALKLPAPSIAMLQILLQLMLGFVAHDLQRAKLKYRGYRMSGVIVAESEIFAQRRYYEHAA